MSTAPKLVNPILQTQGLSPEQVIEARLFQGHSHILQLDCHEYDKELSNCEKLIKAPELFFKDPVGSVIQNSTSLVDVNFQSSTEKSGVIAQVSMKLRGLNLAGSFVDQVQLVVDEMFSNAIYNAPATDLKTNINSNVDRSSGVIAMHSGKTGRIYVAHDDTRVLLGCADPYGTLNLDYYLGKVLGNYQNKNGPSINFGPGGAGIGSYIIFNSGSSLYFGVSPGNATIISCVFPMKMNNRQRSLVPKNLHCIQY